MANVFLTLAHGLGLDLASFGDSTGEFDLNAAPETTVLRLGPQTGYVRDFASLKPGPL